MTNDKATPRPWEKVSWTIFNTNGKSKHICTMAHSKEKSEGTSKAEKEANAELIVRCVNGWDSLVAQRDSLLEACRSSKLAMETSGFASGYGKKVYDRVCEAITKATEGR